MRTAVCLIVKNEVDCILEWMAHHASIGFDDLIIYDNGSDDGTLEEIRRFSSVAPCHVMDWTPETHDPQIDAYNDCLRRFGERFDWIAFFDADEFLVPSSAGLSLTSFLAAQADASAICVNWLTFGSSGLEDKGDDFVMDTFVRRGPLDYPLNAHVKTIVRPAAVSAPCNNPHWFPVKGPTLNVSGEPVIFTAHQAGIVVHDRIVHGDFRLHHYYTRGAKHWRRRMARGQFGGLVVTQEHFRVHDRNDVLDATARASATLAREKLRSLGIDR